MATGRRIVRKPPKTIGKQRLVSSTETLQGLLAWKRRLYPTASWSLCPHTAACRRRKGKRHRRICAQIRMMRLPRSAIRATAAWSDVMSHAAGYAAVRCDGPCVAPPHCQFADGNAAKEGGKQGPGHFCAFWLSLNRSTPPQTSSSIRSPAAHRQNRHKSPAAACN